ncbi:MAG: class IV adenylate cyclase [Patescibacteria group bacterium]|nr:class IV adenylate cyclase [Patescibacteria group bacterium]
MTIEYEATFANIDKDEIKDRLKSVGAKLIKPEFLQKRENFSPHNDGKGWIRVRDEGDKITMSYKRLVSRDNIDGQKEICLEIDDYDEAKSFLETLGFKQKNFQESKREIWELDGVEICIDEWPFLEPFVEVEGKNEIEVKNICEKLGFDYSQAKFCATGNLYEEKYNVPSGVVNNHTPKIIFDMENPFLNYGKK